MEEIQLKAIKEDPNRIQFIEDVKYCPTNRYNNGLIKQCFKDTTKTELFILMLYGLLIYSYLYIFIY